MTGLKFVAVAAAAGAMESVASPFFSAWERFGVAGVFLVALIAVWLDARCMRKELVKSNAESVKAAQQLTDASYRLLESSKDMVEATKQCRRANP